MTLLGLDLNSSRLRAVSGPAGSFSFPLPLDPPALELPLILNLEKKALEVGQTGARQCRRAPFLVCQNFLPHLAEPPAAARKWVTRHHRLDANHALRAILKHLQPACASAKGMVIALPGYLRPNQVEMLMGLSREVRLPVLGTLTSSLAAALAGYAEQAWFGSSLVADIDDHALTLSMVHASEGKARLLETRSLPFLGLRAWKERLLNAMADCCVWQSRRDPRDSPQAEQALYDQLEPVMDACGQGRVTQIALQASNWYQNLLLSPEQAVAFCSELILQTLREIRSLWMAPWPDGLPGGVVATAAVGRLPGLVGALQEVLECWSAPAPPKRGPSLEADWEEDFGIDLLEEGPEAGQRLLVLSPDALARAAHNLACRLVRGEVPPGHFDPAAPLPLPHPVEAGPARLQYRGQDFPLDRSSFTLGRHRACNLVFDGDVYTCVSPRHCEIVFDHRTYTLHDRSREGTLVNDCPVAGSVILKPGDWIRLGDGGPLLRFLGQGTIPSSLMTTA